jgi:predicted esterase
MRFMNVERLTWIAACLALCAFIPGCGGNTPASGWRDFAIKDFDKVHSPVDGDTNKGLIFGAIPVLKPARDLSPELAAFLGRWEGFDLSPPVRKDTKGVLVVSRINSRGGKAFLYACRNLQFPYAVKEIDFEVVQAAVPSIRWKVDFKDGPEGMDGTAVYSFACDKASGVMRGGINLPEGGILSGPFELQRGSAFFVYKDYARYFESERFYPKKYRDAGLSRYGQGYLVYLPEGYEAHPERKWPLILFLIGSGDRGPDVYQFAKNGPFQYVREKGALPFIIVAPMLDVSNDFRSFPETYLDGVIAEISADYRVDARQMYLTGLSMGGEASYRYVLHRPGTFAAVAPLAAFDARFNPGALSEGFVPFAGPLSRAEGLPIRAFHGEDDIVVPLSAARATAEEFRKAGALVDLRVLEGHDHDVWTDTYLDPGFYEWLLSHSL